MQAGAARRAASQRGSTDFWCKMQCFAPCRAASDGKLSRAYDSLQYGLRQDNGTTAIDPGCGRASDHFRWVGDVGRAVSGAGCTAVVWRRMDESRGRPDAAPLVIWFSDDG